MNVIKTKLPTRRKTPESSEHIEPTVKRQDVPLKRRTLKTHRAPPFFKRTNEKDAIHPPLPIRLGKQLSFSQFKYQRPRMIESHNKRRNSSYIKLTKSFFGDRSDNRIGLNLMREQPNCSALEHTYNEFFPQISSTPILPRLVTTQNKEKNSNEEKQPVEKEKSVEKDKAVKKCKSIEKGKAVKKCTSVEKDKAVKQCKPVEKDRSVEKDKSEIDRCLQDVFKDDDLAIARMSRFLADKEAGDTNQKKQSDQRSTITSTSRNLFDTMIHTSNTRPADTQAAEKSFLDEFNVDVNEKINGKDILSHKLVPSDLMKSFDEEEFWKPVHDPALQQNDCRINSGYQNNYTFPEFFPHPSNLAPARNFQTDFQNVEEVLFTSFAETPCFNDSLFRADINHSKCSGSPFKNVSDIPGYARSPTKSNKFLGNMFSEFDFDFNRLHEISSSKQKPDTTEKKDRRSTANFVDKKVSSAVNPSLRFAQFVDSPKDAFTTPQRNQPANIQDQIYSPQPRHQSEFNSNVNLLNKHTNHSDYSHHNRWNASGTRLQCKPFNRRRYSSSSDSDGPSLDAKWEPCFRSEFSTTPARADDTFQINHQEIIHRTDRILESIEKDLMESPTFKYSPRKMF